MAAPPRLADIDIDQLPDEMFPKLGLTREQFGVIQQTMKERGARTPPVGATAPDFEIERLSPDGKRTGEMFRLAETRGRPVALVFGSYT
jgi:hypothetical protein